LTKSDLVDAETLEVVRMEVADFVRGSFLDTSRSPIIPVSAMKGAGLAELKRELLRVADGISVRDNRAIVRLPVDRVFTMKGFGTVVTGTLVAGTIKKEHELQVFPSGEMVRVRGVQVHGKSAEQAVAGERTALNVAGIEKGEIVRGTVLSSPALLQSSSRLDVKLSLLASAKPLKNRSRVHFHAFSSATIAAVTLHEAKQLTPGNEALAQLRLSVPSVLVPGDRFIIRQFSPVITIGGGVVLDAAPLTRSSRPAQLAFLRSISESDSAAILKARVARRGNHGLIVGQAIAETGWRREKIEQLSNVPGEILRIGQVLITSDEFGAMMRRILETLDRFHKHNPLLPGMTAEALHNDSGGGDLVFDFALDSMLREGKVESRDGLLRLAGRGVEMKDEEAESRKAIEQAFASAGLKVPALKDVLAGLKIDKARAQKIVTLLLRDKTLIKISDDLVFHQTVLAALRKSLADQKTRSPHIDISRFKDLTGVSRKYAIPLLEYLDRERVTRREGDSRRIL
jgi:selenocysteine-specific elongation factor